jgi:beta-glucosidase
MKTRSGIIIVLSKALLFLLVLLSQTSSVLGQGNPPYRDPKLPLEQRVADLLSRMTLEEKIAQLTSAMGRPAMGADDKSAFTDTKGLFQPEKAAVLLKNGIGQIAHPSGSRGPREMAEFTNAVQKWVKENTRLGIPVLFHDECLHGHLAVKGTSFPQAIALASTWDPALVENVFSATANEARSRGSQQCLSPVLDILRDPRWGRTEETYGEDPYLGSRIGVAAVKGFQGPGPLIDKSHVIATGKHFAVHGQPEGGSNTAPGNYSERIMREYFLKPFASHPTATNSFWITFFVRNGDLMESSYRTISGSASSTPNTMLPKPSKKPPNWLWNPEWILSCLI